MAPVDTILSLSGKVRIGVARPIPVEDEEYEETPPETTRYMGEQLLESNAQNGRGKLRLFKISSTIQGGKACLRKPY